MSYTKRDDVMLANGWSAVELDTGALAAVRCDRKRVDAGVCYHAQAKAIDAGGAGLLDANGRAIATELKHTVGVSRVDDLGDVAITRECLLAVLGEPVALFNWPASVLSSVSLRVSIAAAGVSGAADAGAVL